MNQSMKQPLFDGSDRQALSEPVNQPVLGVRRHQFICLCQDDDGAAAYATRGRVRKVINKIRYLLGDDRFGRPFGLRKLD